MNNNINSITDYTQETYLNICYSIYRIVEDIDKMKEAKEKFSNLEIEIALRKTLGTFVAIEEYEKCDKIKKILIENSMQLIPIFEYSYLKANPEK